MLTPLEQVVGVFPSPPRLGSQRVVSFTVSCESMLVWFRARACLCAYSWSVRTFLAPKSRGRSSGVPTISVPGHTPWRSGSPQGVLGGAYIFAVCATAGAMAKIAAQANHFLIGD